MRIIYFDIVDGISGDMIVASLLDLGDGFRFLRRQLRKLAIRNYNLSIVRKTVGHSTARQFLVKENKKSRSLQPQQAIRIIKKSKFSAQVKHNMLAIYETLCSAEKKVHSSDAVDFHQLGEIDTLIDIASSCLLIEELKVEKIFYSGIPFGNHVAPATALMLKQRAIRFCRYPFENITPTGIAIVTTLGTQVSSDVASDFALEAIGYGTGSYKAIDSSNILRVLLLQQRQIKAGKRFEQDQIIVMECSVDDMSPQIIGFTMERLYEAGALEVYIQSYYTKKSRMGFLISVLSKSETFDRIADILFQETSTLGIRYVPSDRLVLPRRIRHVKTPCGSLRVKEARVGNTTKMIPEYDDCALIARKRNVPLREIFKGATNGTFRVRDL